MLRSVTWRVDRRHDQAGVGQVLQVEGGRVVEGHACARGQHELRLRPPRELATTRDIVVVEVGLEHLADVKAVVS